MNNVIYVDFKSKKKTDKQTEELDRLSFRIEKINSELNSLDQSEVEKIEALERELNHIQIALSTKNLMEK